MATGLTLHEVEEKKPDGFFPKVFQTVCRTMGDENVDKMEEVCKDPKTMIRFTYELEAYKKALEIKEFYPEKNPHECKIKKEYGNKAYQEGKDIDALHFYTQVNYIQVGIPTYNGSWMVYIHTYTQRSG